MESVFHKSYRDGWNGRTQRVKTGVNARDTGKMSRTHAPDVIDHAMHIVVEMRDGIWTPATSRARVRELAKEWGESERYVEDRALDAGRHIQLSVRESPEMLRGTLSMQLEAICIEARRAGQYAPAVRAIETRARLLRLVEEPKQQPGHLGSFGSAREALAFIKSVLPELELQAAAEIKQLPDAAKSGVVAKEQGDE